MRMSRLQCIHPAAYLTEKRSIIHVNKAFNGVVRSDFLTFIVNGINFKFMNVIDVGAGNGEIYIAHSKNEPL